ncbi:hypothetical protein [Rhizobium sp. CECT 9324]|uniref:hypothetical protein n=1 Tax=Rhizobium sp. CECT 9324 TaxID=2845820 RepID=UPI001E4936B4|nr:hypothetical protein [Rhizobium sp. CECT 9324]CAH0343032.1 hypothetical protein RHI9324_04765 [Rhizobium sp. CECT 9324]
MTMRQYGNARAEDIQLKSGRVTLIWPLTLHLHDPPERSSVVDYTSDGIANDIRDAYEAANGHSRTHMWEPVIDPLCHYPRPERPKESSKEAEAAYAARLTAWENEAYAEAVYFHEFVQAFLYRQHESKDKLAPFRLFRRSDVRAAKIVFQVGSGQVEKTVEVERVNLYIFRTGVALFTMDMVIPQIGEASSCGWSLAEFQNFHDCVRRLYAPYFLNNGAFRCQGPLVVKRVEWLGEDRQILHRLDGTYHCYDLAGDVTQVDDFVGNELSRGQRYPPIFRHWRALLPREMALAPYDDACRPKHAVVTQEGDLSACARWHHVVDERMPTLAMVDVTDMAGGSSRFEQINRGDFIRLCFADSSGADRFPYDEAFVENFEKDHCYDRFFSTGTRMMVCGYSFVAVSGGNFAGILSTHMKRHYFQMALMAHMEVASLLGFSGQISRAVQRFGNEVAVQSEEKFEHAMAAIQEQFLLFIHRFRFTGVTNQLQGAELYDLWRKHLRAQGLFQDVESEVSVANDYLQARADRRTSNAGEKLAVVGAIAVLIGTIIGLLGMNLFFDSGIWGPMTPGEGWKSFKKLAPVHVGVAGTVTFFTGGVGLVWLWPRSGRRQLHALDAVQKFSIFLVALGALMAAASAFALRGV